MKQEKKAIYEAPKAVIILLELEDIVLNNSLAKGAVWDPNDFLTGQGEDY